MPPLMSQKNVHLYHLSFIEKSVPLKQLDSTNMYGLRLWKMVLPYHILRYVVLKVQYCHIEVYYI